jgi:hypothetical protein
MVNKAEFYDYRRIEGDCYDKYKVCSNCATLSDIWFLILMKAKEGIGKKRIMAKIVGGNWKDYLIEFR